MTAPPVIVRLGRDNPHLRAYHEFRLLLLAFLRAERGRSSRLARHLHVGRQSVHRWTVRMETSPPAWAALAANVWLHRQLTPALRRVLSASACPTGAGQLNPRTNKNRSPQPLLL